MELHQQRPYTLEVQYLGALRKNHIPSETVQVNGDETISEIIDRLSIDRELVSTAILDDTFVRFDSKVKRGAKLKLLALLGGG